MKTLLDVAAEAAHCDSQSVIGPRERPILFSAPMVRALLAGRKTQTRRVVRFDRRGDRPGFLTVRRSRQCIEQARLVEGVGPVWPAYNAAGEIDGVRPLPAEHMGCPLGRPGDRLWVQEAHRVLGHGHRCPDAFLTVEWLADGAQAHRVVTPCEYELFRARRRAPYWRGQPGRFMYRSLSRLTLEIAAVRVERLQALGEAEAVVEGIEVFADGAGYTVPREDGRPGAWRRHPQDAFRDLWEGLHGPASWAANPWVWVVDFVRV